MHRRLSQNTDQHHYDYQDQNPRDSCSRQWCVSASGESLLKWKLVTCSFFVGQDRTALRACSLFVPNQRSAFRALDLCHLFSIARPDVAILSHHGGHDQLWYVTTSNDSWRESPSSNHRSNAISRRSGRRL
jgi:hypothetical protein